MKLLKNMFFCSLLAGSSLIGVSQNYMKCDYIRKLEVNQKINSIYEHKRNNFISYEKIDFKKPLNDEVQNSLEDKILNIYFPTNESDISSNDESDIRKYACSYLKPNSKWIKINSFTIEGFADFRGGASLNYDLSKKRAENVLEKIQPFFPKSDYYICAYGESKSFEGKDSLDLAKDRVVKIIPNENPLNFALSNLLADVYLLDQSGSMNTNSEWRLLQNYIYPENCEVYSFSKIEGGNYDYGYKIKNAIAEGRTSYYSALDTLLSSVKNKTITTMINGKDNVGGATSEEIIRKAKQNNVVLNLIGLNLKDEDKKDFLKIIEETNGKYYFLEKKRL